MKKENLGTLFLYLVELALGILLLIDHVKFTTLILTAGGVALVVGAVVNIIHYFREDALEAAADHTFSKGLVLAALGLFCIFRSEWIISTFPLMAIFYGIAALVMGFVKIEGTIDLLRLKIGGWQFAAINALLTVVFSVVVLLNPFKAEHVLWVFLGIALVVVAILDVAALFVAGRERK